MAGDFACQVEFTQGFGMHVFFAAFRQAAVEVGLGEEVHWWFRGFEGLEGLEGLGVDLLIC